MSHNKPTVREEKPFHTSICEINSRKIWSNSKDKLPNMLGSGVERLTCNYNAPL